MLQSVHDKTVDPVLLFMCDEAWFHLNGSTKIQNTHHSDTKNSHTVHEEVPLHYQKVSVLHAVSGWRIIWPHFKTERTHSITLKIFWNIICKTSLKKEK
jgi:hypothetical protein